MSIAVMGEADFVRNLYSVPLCLVDIYLWVYAVEKTETNYTSPS